MAGALGFATAENIEYVFGTSQSPIPGTSVFIGEIVVLLIRVLMPIHVICSVIQAANLSKVKKTIISRYKSDQSLSFCFC
jgi:RsiW-degrading membrane proteinase PrsW (M82 family)